MSHSASWTGSSISLRASRKTMGPITIAPSSSTQAPTMLRKVAT